MISAIITLGIGFGGVNYIPTLGFTSAVAVSLDSIVFASVLSISPGVYSVKAIDNTHAVLPISPGKYEVRSED